MSDNKMISSDFAAALERVRKVRGLDEPPKRLLRRSFLMREDEPQASFFALCLLAQVHAARSR
jgi:hypothetical protein